jgi:hypothetical protein
MDILFPFSKKMQQEPNPLARPFFDVETNPTPKVVPSLAN